MKKAIALVFMLALSSAFAEDKKPAAKKSSASKPAAKSDKNVAQKAEADLTKWARDNKIWGSPKK